MLRRSTESLGGTKHEMTILAEQSTAEGRIFNEVIALLERQRDEPVGASLSQLLSQLTAIYMGKNKVFDYATCQMGLALLHFGLGDHDEARRQTINAMKTGSAEEHIVSNAMVLLCNAGELNLAHDTAKDAAGRFAGNPLILRQAANVLLDTLDFRASAERFENLLQMVGDEGQRQSFSEKRDQMLSLARHAEELGFSAGSLRDRAQCAVDALRAQNFKTFWVNLRGTKANSVALEFHVDADVETCAELNFVVADALVNQFEDTAMSLITMSVRSFTGRPNVSREPVLEFHA